MKFIDRLCLYRRSTVVVTDLALFLVRLDLRQSVARDDSVGEAEFFVSVSVSCHFLQYPSTTIRNSYSKHQSTSKQIIKQTMLENAYISIQSRSKQIFLYLFHFKEQYTRLSGIVNEATRDSLKFNPEKKRNLTREGELETKMRTEWETKPKS